MYPTFLYHRTFVNGKVFTDQDEYDKSKKEGWVSSPADIVQSVIVPEPEVSKKGYPAKKKKLVKSKKRVR